jgi:glycosyltransferase involved in cell wall biosynthesis
LKFSIIICAYNPKNYLLDRLLNSIIFFDKLSPFHEVIIVDNNSNPTLSENNYINKFLKCKANSQIIVEKRAGLTAARIAGIKKSKYDWIIFFDDDNEPAIDYLIKLHSSILQHPNVACWGAGKIEVEFITNKVPEWLEIYKPIFQERSVEKCIIDKQPWWQDHYPHGTGLTINKKTAVEYIYRVNKGVYSLSDRSGNSLSSGGDVQIVLTAISLGFSVAITPEIKMRHLIGASKVTNRYLIRHAFGTASSNLPAHFQVFPFTLKDLKLPSNIDILKKIYFLIKVKLLKEGSRSFKVILAHFLGELKGIYLLRTDCKPSLIYLLLTRMMRLK